MKQDRPGAWRSAVVLAGSLALIGCTSLQTVVDTQGPQGGGAAPGGRMIAAKDTLTVTPRQGERFQIEVVSVSGSEIEGTVGAEKTPLTVRLADVERVERREFDGLKTAFLVISIAAGVYALAKIAAQAALASNL